MKNKTLAIISDCLHTIDASGKFGTANHIFLKQMEALSAQFKKTVICCPFVDYRSDQIISVYTNQSIDFIKLKNVGGDRLKDKIEILLQIPGWINSFRKLRNVDYVYQRFPDNLNIPGFFFFKFTKQRRFATYTGTWNKYKKEPVTYRFQKWLLKNHFNAPVFIYADKQKSYHLIPTFSPSYDEVLWLDEKENVRQKITNVESKMKTPVFVSVGSMVPLKNQLLILQTFKILHKKNYKFKLILVGDGVLKSQYETFVLENKMEDVVFLTGNKNSTQLQDVYRKADFIIQASLVEGYGKVPVEGFFFGVIPILNKTGFAQEFTGSGKRGFLFDAQKPDDLLNLLERLYATSCDFASMISAGRQFSKDLTISKWVNEMITELKTFYND